jgi:hypothetical protein
VALHAESFPNKWSESYIVSLFKSGDRFDPLNYRGLSISSCLGKLFTKLMSKRLIDFLVENNIININQIGFMPKHRTADHILVLKTIFDLFKSKNKTVYLCFIDIKKAFDTVWREGLLFKLIKYGISTKICNLKNNMYNKLNTCLKLGDQRTEFFKSEIGTRQGCNLSPLLFNIYINELPELFLKSKCDPIEIGYKKYNALLYADDLAILSKSSEGLQRALDVLHTFCNRWKLKININKTKVIIFNAKKTNKFKFTIEGEEIGIVNSYTYLGITFTVNVTLW